MSLVSVETQYIILAYITVVFTVLALIENEQNQKSIILQYMSGGMWLVSGVGIFLAGDTASALTWGMAYLFLGFAFMFFIAGSYNSFGIIKARRKQT